MSTGPRIKPETAHYSAQDRALYTLQEAISQGVYQAGAPLPTERQLSQELGISRPVVRVALLHLAEQGWITREPGHRPRVAISAPSLPSSSTASALQGIAAVLPMEPVYPAAFNVQRGIQRTLQRQEASQRLVVFDSLAGAPPKSATALDGNAGIERHILEAVAREGIVGVILWQIGGADTLPALNELRERGIPVVFVDRYPDLPGVPACDFVGVDNRTGARAAVQYLIDLGHQRIAHLTFRGQGHEGKALSVRERYEGYREALWENGLQLEEDLVNGTIALLDLIQAGGESIPTAVFAVNDASAHRFIEMARSRGIRVPEDISVIGFDDLDRYSHRTPYLTTMYVPFEAIGERAAEMLLRRLRDPAARNEPAQHILLSSTLTVRATCTNQTVADSDLITLTVPRA